MRSNAAVTVPVILYLLLVCAACLAAAVLSIL